MHFAHVYVVLFMRVHVLSLCSWTTRDGHICTSGLIAVGVSWSGATVDPVLFHWDACVGCIRVPICYGMNNQTCCAI